MDANHTQIVKELRDQGVSVYSTHQLKGFCDIVAGYKGMNYLFEIKDPNKPPSATRLTEKEKEFQNSWRGQVETIYTSDEALGIIQNRPFHKRINLERK